MNVEEPLITIIIPCYNAENYIHFSLKSVLKQTYKNWECFLINDGSKDNTAQILQEYSLKDTRFKFLSHENKGISETRNLGMDNAKGDYLFFLDADDLIPENALQIFINEIEEDIDVITGITVTVNGENLEEISQLQHPKEGCVLFKNNNLEVLIFAIEAGLAPVAQNRLYNNEFLKRNNLRFKSGILHEDESWFFEVMFRAEQVKFINHKTYYYRTDNSESITKNLGDRNLQSYLIILENIFENYYRNTTSYRKAVVERYLQYLKKVIIDFAIREKKKLSVECLLELTKVLKIVHTKSDPFSILSKKNETYYKALNKLSLFPFNMIESYFFKNPVNSIRKRYKLLQIKYFLK
ncbi:glycosyltransferase [Chryseobacterium sp. SNU WT5]|uniref:glycosyltransferase family 2 protein n=1 Tax=Chryseobacterium sp. SNU WT5 TaxID=2594269 RepID=UPI00117DCEA7|nr:glycosyltransferase [Chryseobacterium sp. SNU WT5]QDP84654.1 glycosyltransferase [Chryseobacterium sp. SNU WT5]